MTGHSQAAARTRTDADPGPGAAAAELEAALRSVTHTGVRLTGAQVGIFLAHGDRLDLERPPLPDLCVVHGPRRTHPDDRPDAGASHALLLAALTSADRGVVRVDDLIVDRRGEDVALAAHTDVRGLAVRSYLAVPVTSSTGTELGRLVFAHRAPGRFDEGAALAAQAIAAHAATIAAHAHLLGAARRARRDAEDGESRLRLLQRMTALLSSAASTHEITVRVPAAVTAALGCVGAHLFLLEPSDPGDADSPPVLAGVVSEVFTPAVRRDMARVPLDSSSPAARAARTAAPALVVGPELRAFRPLLRDGQRVEAIMAVPLIDTDRRPVGALTTFWSTETAASSDVEGLLMAVAGQVAQALERSRLFDAERLARTDLADSVEALGEVARTLQRSLLPRRLPALERVAVAVSYLPALEGAEVGGDWYDVIESGDGIVTFVIGDVQGHSTTAAGLMGQLRTAVRAYVIEGHDPATALTRTNAVLYALDVELFATCALLQLDQGTGEVLLATAGHPLPQALTATGARALHADPGPPLGVVEDVGYGITVIRLDEATRVVLHTDGVVESSTHDLDLGIEALRRAADPRVAQGPRVAADRILAAIPHRLTDDAALLVLDYAGPRAPREEISTLLPPTRASVSQARILVRDVMASWGVEGDVVDSAQLVVSELVTNAVNHTGGAAELVITRDAEAGLLRIAVSDSSSRHPTPRPPSADSLGGRGMAIVDVLALSWGVLPQGEGKLVWALLALP